MDALRQAELDQVIAPQLVNDASKWLVRILGRLTNGFVLDPKEWPGLDDLVRTATQHWHEAVIELIARTASSNAVLGQYLDVGESHTRQLTSVTFGISDMHDAGRSAAILHFGQRKVVYKPRDLHPENLLTAALGTASREALGLDTFVPWMVCANQFGFMEFVDHEPCVSREAVALCYRRYGALIAIAHAMSARDLHEENVIVHADSPVPVDAEVMGGGRLALSPGFRDSVRNGEAHFREALGLQASVLDSLLLPVVRTLSPSRERPSGNRATVGALAHGAALRTSLPVLNGETCLPASFVEEVLDGFDRVGTLCARGGSETAAIISQLPSVKSRVVVRPTAAYELLLTRSLRIECLENSSIRRRRIEDDLREMNRERIDAVDGFVSGEVAALMTADIPRFTMTSVGPGSPGSEGMGLQRRGDNSAYGAGEDLQRRSIRQALHASAEIRSTAVSTPAGWESAAVRVAEFLAATTQRLPDGASRVFAGYWPTAGQTLAHMNRESLFDGCAGTAVLLADASAVAGRPEWAELALEYVRPCFNGRVPAQMACDGGLARGLGGLVYALVRIGRACRREECLDGAEVLLDRYASDLVGGTSDNDLVHGAAGLLLALLAFERHRPGHAVSALVNRVAGEVTKRCCSDPRPAVGSRPDCFTSLGVGGIAMSLAAWAKSRGDRAGALLARSWLDSAPSHGAATPPGGRDRASQDWTWSGGRSGLLLARLKVCQALDEPIAGDKVSVEIGQGRPSDVLVAFRPGLCQGTAGAVDALVEIRRNYASPDLCEKIEAAAQLLVEFVSNGPLDTFDGSLFGGLAGTAHALLRAAQPDRVSCLMSFE